MAQSTIKTIQNEIKKREAEIDALKRALAALNEAGGRGQGKRRTMSAAAREKIRQAQIKRWKKLKRSGEG